MHFLFFAANSVWIRFVASQWEISGLWRQRFQFRKNVAKILRRLFATSGRHHFAEFSASIVDPTTVGVPVSTTTGFLATFGGIAGELYNGTWDRRNHDGAEMCYWDHKTWWSNSQTKDEDGGHSQTVSCQTYNFLLKETSTILFVFMVVFYYGEILLLNVFNTY